MGKKKSLIASYQQAFCLKYQWQNISAPHEVTEVGT